MALRDNEMKQLDPAFAELLASNLDELQEEVRSLHRTERFEIYEKLIALNQNELLRLQEDVGSLQSERKHFFNTNVTRHNSATVCGILQQINDSINAVNGRIQETYASLFIFGCDS